MNISNVNTSSEPSQLLALSLLSAVLVALSCAFSWVCGCQFRKL